ncbi:hypothetical protein [Pleionea mediterranea]|uniref:YD repeat-containing protein n=1 Tax=Pleionea mediterranea TaxID=523701 RepID=A0A316FWP6_9GAMM|nr:hypothetical protein [Pleionea mediterranea]PWK52813.1 hypothetical protein C8D97_10431 [Pleionea mediterranea]
MFIRIIFKTLFLTGLSLSLISCGGGSSYSDDPPVVTAKTGIFMNGTIENLRYSTASQSGFTDSNGEFLYLDGETVSFYVGDILIGSASVAASLDLFDLANTSAPITGLEIRNAIFDFKNDSSFHSVINIALFLQTLDADDNVGNNTQIPDELHTIAEGETINFEQLSFDFVSDFKLRKLIAMGRADGLWGGSKQIRNPGLALDTLYNDLGLTADLYLLASSVTDEGNDGSNDRTGLYAFDQSSSQYFIDIDNDADGTLDVTDTYSFDGNSNLLQYENVVIPTTFYTLYSYDDNGNRESEREDENGDGSADDIRDYTYDENGSLITLEVDSDGDGTLNYSRAYTYDDNGNRITSETDSGANGTVTQRITYSYDDNNNLILEEWDQQPDGVIDITYTYTRDDNGNVTLREWDKDGDGVADDIRNWTYDANGNQTLYEQDSDGDGNLDFIQSFEYDENNNRTLYELDNNGDGVVDFRNLYSYDSNELISTFEIDSDGDDVWDEVRTYTFDNNANLTLIEYDTDADGTIDRVINQTFNTDRDSWNAYWITQISDLD